MLSAAIIAQQSTSQGGIAGIPNVADADARRSIDPTGKTTGFQVTQDDDPGFVYTFQGDGADADAGLRVVGAGSDDYNGSYAFDGSNYVKIDGGHYCTGLGMWLFDGSPSSYVTAEFPTYAWQVVTWFSGGFNVSDPPPTVTRNPFPNDRNWLRTSYP